MKKWYYFSLMLGLVLGSFTFTACGDDDDEDNNNKEKSLNDDSQAKTASIIGTWSAVIPAQEVSDNNADPYTHKLVYEFKDDNTFRVTTSAFDFGSEGEGIENMLLPDDPKPSAGEGCYDIMRIRFAGTYSTADGKLTLTVKKGWEYDYGRNGTEEERWGGPEGWDIEEDQLDEDVSNPLVLDYSINNNTLTIGNGARVMVHHHHILVGTLTKE